MSILIIDTTERNKISIAAGDVRVVVTDSQMQATDLLREIETLLNNNHIEKLDLKAILVNQGPGSYTGTRIGTTVANCLAWSLDIPIIGFAKENINEVKTHALTSLENKFSKVVLPEYSS